MAHILIAEDDSSMRHFLSMALSRAGHSVDAYGNGQDAFDALVHAAQSYDLLLSDIVMPGMDGIELSKKAAAHVPGMKIMFITGFAAVAPVAGGVATGGAAQVLAKPFHLKDLVDQVETLLAA